MDADSASDTLHRHGRFVHALARALLADPHEADDVAQEAWVQWWRRAEAPASPRAWLARAVRSLAANRRRASERRGRHEALGARSEATRAPDTEAAEAELLHRLVDAVYALEEPYRETILALYLRGQEARALAEAGATPLATVRSRERRALRLLRERLDRTCGNRAAWAATLARLARLEGASSTGALLAPWLVAALLVAAGGLAWHTWTGAEPSAELPLAARKASPLPVSGPLEGELLEGSGVRGRAEPAARLALSPAGTTPLRTARDGSTRLEGVTQDPGGRPLAGVTLRFLRARDEVGRAVSDERGRFQAEGVPSFHALEADCAGYRFLHATDPEGDPLRPFEPMRVTLAPAGQLFVRVRDARGAPLAGVGVSASPLLEERVDTAGLQASLGVRADDAVQAETDAEGLALLPGVWSGVHLALELDLCWGADTGAVRVERQRGGRLALDAGAGQPIVLDGGGLNLEAVWELERELGGLVLDGAGAPVEARVEATDLGYPKGEPGHRLASERSDARGRFLLTFRPAALRGPVRVKAWIPGRTRVAGASLTVPSPELGAEVVLKPAALAAAEPLELRLAPSSRSLLAGVLLDPRGDPAHDRAHMLLLLQDGRPPPRAERVLARIDGGGFLVSSLLPGPCELLVASRDARERAQVLGEPVFTRFTGLSAGAEGLVLRLPASAPVRLRVRGGPLSRLACARFLPSDPAQFPRVHGGASLVASAPAFWIPGSSEILDVPEGTWLVSEDELRGAFEVALALGEPGWYRIGVVRPSLAPVATELLWLDAGEHVLEVHPPPTATLRGRLRADGTRGFYGLVLCDENGRPHPVAAPSAGAAPHVLPLKASGEFLLRELAVGRYRLRAGTVEELAAGRFACESALEVLPGENWLELLL